MPVVRWGYESVARRSLSQRRSRQFDVACNSARGLPPAQGDQPSSPLEPALIPKQTQSGLSGTALAHDIRHSNPNLQLQNSRLARSAGVRKTKADRSALKGTATHRASTRAL